MAGDRLTKTEFCIEARISASTLDRWLRAGKVRASKIGQRVFIARSELDRLAAGEPINDIDDPCTSSGVASTNDIIHLL
jgi:Helix-turn-helix domain